MAHLWTFFEGVPKFYHDAFEQRLFEVPPLDFAGSCSSACLCAALARCQRSGYLFLRELRGARFPYSLFGRPPRLHHAELVSALMTPRSQAVGDDITGSSRDTEWSTSSSRCSRQQEPQCPLLHFRYFLKAWLAVAKPAREAARLKPIEKALAPALRRLEISRASRLKS